MWWKIFDLVPGWIYAIIVAALLVLSGACYVAWSGTAAKFAAYKAEVAEATRQAEADARAAERIMQRKTEKIADEAQKRQEELAARVVAAANAAASLRDGIAALNARPAPADPGAASFAREASTARELLGACAERYRSVAAEADGLSGQVAGLQRYVAEVCRASAGD